MTGIDSSSGLVSQSHVYGWKHRVLAIDEEMRALGAERSKLERLIAMADEIERESGLLDEASDDGRAHPQLISRALEGLSSKDKFPTAVALIVERAENGVKYDDIREAILLSPLGNKLRISDKGFYHALARGKQKGSLVEHNGFIFTPENLKAFLRKVKAGIKQDKTLPPTLGSPLMAALMETIANKPGIIAKEAIELVRNGSDKHKLKPIKNEGSAYNAVARLKQRGEIEGFGHQNRQLRIGPNAPEDMKKLSRSGVVVPIAKTNTAASQ